MRIVLKFLVWIYHRILRVVTRFGPATRRFGPEGCTVLLTGTYSSDNWIRAHLLPLARSRTVSRVVFVSAAPLPHIEGVVAVHPPGWLVRVVGPVPARLATFCVTAFRTRPAVVGGFHLLVNGMVALLLARMVGAVSLYICVGSGPTEVLSTGLTENRLFRHMGGPDRYVTRTLLSVVGMFDVVVTMGSRARDYFREHREGRSTVVIPGGMEWGGTLPSSSPPDFDLVFVGRLVPVKQVDLLLKAAAVVRKEHPSLRVAIVGDGPLRPFLEELSRELSLEESVEFAGMRPDVERFLARSRLFVLTSRSEGLALSLIEAMRCGLPAVVPDVGDLADLVADGKNGYLVKEASPAAYAERILALLKDDSLRSAFSTEAARRAERFRPASMSEIWDGTLSGFAFPA
jgi:glycosyltransferase involved in cell wall biosynthesis